MHRILRPGGTLAFSCHNNIGWIPIVESVCKKLGLPMLSGMDPMRSWNDDSWLPQLQEIFQAARLEWMENPVTITEEQDDDFAGMVGMMWPMVTQGWPEEGKSKKEEVIAGVKAYLRSEREKGDVIVRMAGPLFVAHK